jgi:glycogen debranching enzyme
VEKARFSSPALIVHNRFSKSLMPSHIMTKISRTLINRALRIAVGDLAGNICNYKNGLLEIAAPCLMAGLDYDSPWTRDAAFNTWYGLAILSPAVARNTLLSVLVRESDGKVRIGGEYWDAIIWAQGTWQYFLLTGDRSLLELSLSAVENSLNYFEATEFDSNDGLFRGGACFQDGIAAYPDYLAPVEGDKFYSGITGWLEKAGAQPVKTGVGIPCKALSTNCLYFRAYQIANLLAREVGETANPLWESKANALHQAINKHFWREELGTYGYLLDAPDNDDRQEGLGLAFALLFGIADDAKAKRIFENVYLSAQGMPCVWPTYARYKKDDEFGRHSGTIWPQVNAAWALACEARGRNDLALYEINLLAEKACRDSQFIEVYHPETGIPYGGLQEDPGTNRIQRFGICHRQSWCASGYIGMVAASILGLAVKDDRPLSPGLRAKLLAQIPEINFADSSVGR